LFETTPPNVKEVPLPAEIAVFSFNATGTLIALAVPALTVVLAPKPLSSTVKVVPDPLITSELGLLNVRAPTVSLESKVTALPPALLKMAEEPARFGTPPLQLPVSDQFWLLLPSVQVPTTPAAVTVKMTELPLMDTTPLYPATMPLPVVVGMDETVEPPAILVAVIKV
jgi:hypothetical protein